MATAIITGSTRGIGLGLAENFLRQGWNVVINGRSEDKVQEVCSGLSKMITEHKLHITAAGKSGDVTKSGEMAELFDFAHQWFGSVEIWVNNAGIGHPYKRVWELEEEIIRKVIEINCTGTILATATIVKKMLKQGYGHIYNMEGFGSNGRVRSGITVYGASKRALRFWSRSLANEVQDTNVMVSRLSPGIVITDFLTEQFKDDPEGFTQAKRIFNILGDKVETVTPWLVKKMIKNKKNNALFAWLTPGKLLGRFVTARIRKRQIIS